MSNVRNREEGIREVVFLFPCNDKNNRPLMILQ